MYSPELLNVASTVPSQLAVPLITEDNLSVRIKWNIPASINFASVTKYRIYIANAGGSFIEDLTYCDGTDSQVIAQLYCQVPMTYLRTDADFLLPYGTLVEA